MTRSKTRLLRGQSGAPARSPREREKKRRRGRPCLRRLMKKSPSLGTTRRTRPGMVQSSTLSGLAPTLRSLALLYLCRYNTDTDAEMSDSSDFEVSSSWAFGGLWRCLHGGWLTTAHLAFQDEDEDSWESDELETTPQRDTLSPPEQVRGPSIHAALARAHTERLTRVLPRLMVMVMQDLRGIVGLVRGKGVKPVLCEVGGQNLNCCNLLLQVPDPTWIPRITEPGQRDSDSISVRARASSRSRSWRRKDKRKTWSPRETTFQRHLTFFYAHNSTHYRAYGRTTLGD